MRITHPVPRAPTARVFDGQPCRQVAEPPRPGDGVACDTEGLVNPRPELVPVLSDSPRRGGRMCHAGPLIVALALSLATDLGFSRPAAAQTPEVADLILHRGKIVTLDDANRIASAIAIRDGRILAIGDESLITR